MNQPAPPNPALVMPILWGSLMSAQAIIVGLTFFLAHGKGVTPTFELANLLPGEGMGGFHFAGAVLVAIAAVLLPPRLVGLSPSPPGGSEAQRAMVPFIVNMAMAEAATLVGFFTAIVFATPPVPERIILPALCGLVAGLLGFPSASRIKVLAGVRS